MQVYENISIYINNVVTATEYHIKGFSDYRNIALILIKVMFNNLKNLNNI